MKSIWNVELMGDYGEYYCRTIEVEASMNFFQVIDYAKRLFGSENVVTVQFDYNV